VVSDGRQVLLSVVASQVETHERYGGVVPELASREHPAAIVPVVEEAIARAAVPIDAVAVTQGPGLVGSLLVGIKQYVTERGTSANSYVLLGLLRPGSVRLGRKDAVRHQKSGRPLARVSRRREPKNLRASGQKAKGRSRGSLPGSSAKTHTPTWSGEAVPDTSL
jgi:hypothetical protein